MERLTGLDAAFLALATPSSHMHVMAAMVLDPSDVPGGLHELAELTAEIAAAIPASVRTATERGARGNRVSAMFATLATQLDDPVERLFAAREVMGGAKSSATSTASFGLIGCREIVPHIDDIAAAVPDALVDLVKAAADR